jgi:hypothetical protein
MFSQKILHASEKKENSHQAKEIMPSLNEIAKKSQ